MEPIFFATPQEFRDWLETHHAQHSQLLVGFYKKSSGKPSITWPQAVDEALCFGWIDGVRNTINEVSYMIRFTPRKPSSVWSAINIRRASELSSSGLMHPAGLKAFERRSDGKSAIYAYEQRGSAEFPATYAEQFRSRKRAWEFFQAQAPWYQRNATYWVVSAKREETRHRRLLRLMEDSEAQRRLAHLSRPAGRRSAD